jgi:hypothetical protein
MSYFGGRLDGLVGISNIETSSEPEPNRTPASNLPPRLEEDEFGVRWMKLYTSVRLES